MKKLLSLFLVVSFMISIFNGCPSIETVENIEQNNISPMATLKNTPTETPKNTPVATDDPNIKAYQDDFEELRNYLKEIDLCTDAAALEIYYYAVDIFTKTAIRLEELKRSPEFKVEIKNFNLALQDYADVLNQINTTTIYPVMEEGVVEDGQARFYYVFKDKKGKVLLEVITWGTALEQKATTINEEGIEETEYKYKSVLLVNGIPVENNEVIMNLMEPFVPELIFNKIKYYEKDSGSTDNANQ